MSVASAGGGLGELGLDTSRSSYYPDLEGRVWFFDSIRKWESANETASASRNRFCLFIRFGIVPSHDAGRVAFAGKRLG